MDLNIKYKGSASEREVSSTLRRLQELGWQGMAWNQHILSKATVKNTVKPRPDSTASGSITGNSVHHGTNMSTVDLREIAKTRVMVDSSISSSSSSSSMWSFRQLHRLTITIDDVMDVQSLTSTNELLRGFDILAVCPGNYKVFATCCRQADIDVISFDFSHRVPFAINKKLVSCCSTYACLSIYVWVCGCPYKIPLLSLCDPLRYPHSLSNHSRYLSFCLSTRTEHTHPLCNYHTRDLTRYLYSPLPSPPKY